MGELRTTRKLTAILSMDVAGYSRLMGEDEERTVRDLLALRALVAGLVPARGGRVVDMPGDAILAEFRSAVDAVECALEIQSRSSALMTDRDEACRMRLRIGINLGDVIEREGALYGDGVNIAARLESLAQPGGVCVSGTVYDQVAGKVDAAFLDAGEQQVKNISRPVRAFHIRLSHALHREPVAASLAKLSRPRVFEAVARERLFEKLSHLAARPCLWVAGPPGAGKTTVVAGWLESRETPAFWYHADTGDRDPATFFDYLAALGRPLQGDAGKPLPYLTTDYLRDLPAFARRFFRQFFSLLPAGASVVIDNHHDAGGGVFDELLREAVSEVPEGMRLVILSRSEVPAPLVRSLANGAVGRVAWEDLKLTAEEAERIVAARTGNMSADARTLHELSGGWAAGLVLMAATGQLPEAGAMLEPAETVFAYFAEEVLDRAGEDDRGLLLRTSCFPQFTAGMAAELTGHAAPQAVLDSFCRRQYFTERRAGGEGRYRYHDLFRAFLRARAVARFGTEGWRDTLKHAARILAKSDELDAALDLAREAADWEWYADRLADYSASLLARGRWRTLLGWLDALPSESIAANPVLMYWQGMARSGQDPTAGRAILEQAFEAFTRSGDRQYQARVCSEIMNSYFLEWNMVSALDPWIEQMERILSAGEPLPPDVRDAALTSMVQALLNRIPDHPQLAIYADEVEQLLRESADPNARLTKAWVLMYYFDQTGQWSRSASMFSAIEAHLAAEEGLPTNIGLCWNRRAYHHYFIGEFDAGRAAVEKAVQVCEQYGLRDLLYVTYVNAAMIAVATGKLDEAAVVQARMRACLSLSKHVHATAYQWIDLWMALEAGDRARADRIWETFSRMPVPGVRLYAAYNHAIVWLFVLQGKAQLALDRIAQWRAPLTGMRSDWIDFNFLWMETTALLHVDPARARDAMARMFAIGARYRYCQILTWMRGMVAEVCAKALEWRVEPEYVRWLIRTRNVMAPHPDTPFWPRRLEVRVLGGFDVMIDDKRLSFGHKAPRKPLALLKLLALHPRGISSDATLAALWPDLEGDAAADALAAALHRLRKLLGDAEAVMLSEGRLFLDPRRIWVDALAFEALSEAGVHEHQRQALDVYRGRLLPYDDGEGWTIAARERLSGRYLQLVRRLGERDEAEGRLEDAVALYRGAIELEPLGEPLYQGLMRCMRKLGRESEGLAVYRQLQDVLRREIAASPSAQSRELAQRLRGVE